MTKAVIVTSESESGRNQKFHDIKSGKNMNHVEFVNKIERGKLSD